MLTTKDIDVVILCGGLGQRLRSVVKDRPKPMVEINGRPFLDLLLDYAGSFGFKRFILCIGYMGDRVKGYFGKTNLSRAILFSEEKEPLGTGGALKNAEALIRSNLFLVMNGDSFCRLDLKGIIDFHSNKKAILSIGLTKSKSRQGYGVVDIDSSRRIMAFNEKSKITANSLINAGIYLCNNEVLSLIPTNKNFSLEYDLFPKIVNKKVYGYITEEKLIDIGTPERYKAAEEILKNILRTTS